MKVGTTRPALSDNVVSHDLPRTHQRISTLSPRVCLTLTLVAATILALFAGPMFLWVYHIERASRLMEAGLQWPEPRQVDSLPLLRNEHALMDAREHLVAAIRWRPEHSHAYRLLGQSFVAQGDWENAAEAFMQARERAPRHPLIAWEASLVYEHLGRIVAHAPRMALAAELAAGQLDAPARPVETPFCRDGVPQTCYAGETMFTLPYAELAAVPAAELPVLLLHPPARISHEMTIPPDRPALYFALGLDPAAHTWGSDGATFRVWVEPANGGRTTTDASPELAYEYMLGPDMAVQGWVPDWADLSRWAGQTVRLTLETDGGPAGDTTADWYGWGDIALTTVEAARAATLAPQARMRQAWNDAGGDARQFVAEGDDDLRQRDFATAYAWYTRARLLREDPPAFDLLFRQAVAAVISSDPESSLLLANVRELDERFEVYDLQDGVKIEGANLRWMTELNPEQGLTYGTPLTYGYKGDSTAGFLWWSGEAVAVISVKQTGSYQISMHVRHSLPAPIEMAMGIDGQKLQRMSLKRGDNSWETISVNTHMTSGLHTIHVWYLNDGVVDGKDRNAVVDWITIERD